MRCIYVVLKTDFYDDQAEWNFIIVAHGLPIDQYVLYQK